MSAKLITGSEIAYSCIPISEEVYEQALDMDVSFSSIYGFVVDGIYRPAEDTTLKCKKDWCLPIVEAYRRKYWVVLKKHPGDLYSPMSYMTGQDHYVVVTYDIWQSEAGLVAVVTETDED